MQVIILGRKEDVRRKEEFRGITVFANSDESDYSTLPEEYESYSVIWTPVSPDEISADYPFLQNCYRGKTNKDPTKGAWMIWENDGRTFSLVVESATITKEDLIRMAESIP